MGAKARPKPKQLARKLAQIRLALGLSQNELIKALDVSLIAKTAFQIMKRGLASRRYRCC